MADYQKMYLTLFRATEQAVNLIIAAKQACEEIYLREDPPVLTLLPVERQQSSAKKEEMT